MRIAIAISFWVAGFVVSSTQAAGPFIEVELNSSMVYIVPKELAEQNKAAIIASIPGMDKIDGFWTPGESNVIMADRVLRETLDRAVKDPATLFPDLAQDADSGKGASPELEKQRPELARVAQHYEDYGRQYVGIIVDGHKLVFCNYAVVGKVDFSANYISFDKYFATDGASHFLQGRIDIETKTCSNVSMIGPWITKGEVLSGEQ